MNAELLTAFLADTAGTLATLKAPPACRGFHPAVLPFTI